MRLPQLDALRFAAVLLVLFRHLPGGGPSHASPLVRGGWVGVDLFFVLSGFLVSGLLFAEYRKTGRLRPLRFLTRRGWKIYPPFYALTTAAVLATLPRPYWWGAVHESVFLQNYLPGLWAHTWSLAIEEHFYLALALTLPLLARRGGPDPFRGVPWAVASVAVACLALRIWTASRHPTFDVYTHLHPTHLRIDSLAFGVLLSYLSHFRPAVFSRLARRPLAIPGALLLAPAFVLTLGTDRFLHTFGFPAFALGSGCLLLAALAAPPARPLAPLAFLGRHSYSVYLWHLPARDWLLPALPPLPWHAQAVSYLVLSFGLGVLLARLIEVPALRLRDRLFPASPGSPSPAATARRP